MPPIPNHALRAAEPSAASSTASATTEPAGGLLVDGGPSFDAEAAAHAEPPPIDPAALAGGEQWTVSRVRALLSAKGELIHGVVAVDAESTEWRYTAADLEAIAPALTRILNRYPVTQAAAAGGDELQLAIGFAGYGMRSYSERRRDLEALRDDDDQAGDVTYADDPEPAAAAEAPVFPAPDATPPIAPVRRL